MEITNGGVDYSFECVGNVEVFRTAFLSTYMVSYYTTLNTFKFFSTTTTGYLHILQLSTMYWYII